MRNTTNLLIIATICAIVGLGCANRGTTSGDKPFGTHNPGNQANAQKKEELGEAVLLATRRQLAKNITARGDGSVKVTLRGKDENILVYTKRTWSEWEINTLLEDSAAEGYRGYRQAGFIVIRFNNGIGETVKKIAL